MRAATACALSASIGHEAGDSSGITPLTYSSTGTALMALMPPNVLPRNSSAPR